MSSIYCQAVSGDQVQQVSQGMTVCQAVSCMMSVVCFPVTFANFLFPPVILDMSSSFSVAQVRPGQVLPHSHWPVCHGPVSRDTVPGAHNSGQVQPDIVMDTGRSLTRSHHKTSCVF